MMFWKNNKIRYWTFFYWYV